MATAPTTTTALYYIHNDHLGTPRALTDQRQEIVWQASYTPFGEAQLTIDTIENNLRFPGQYFDSETNLHYNYHRYYNVETGRYLRSDPIGLGDGPNTYAYVGNNPLAYYDPNGLSKVGAIGQGLGGALGGAVGGLGGNNSSGSGSFDFSDPFSGPSAGSMPGTGIPVSPLVALGICSSAPRLCNSLFPDLLNGSLDNWNTGLPKPIDPWTDTHASTQQCPVGGGPEFEPEEKCIEAAKTAFKICMSLSNNPFSEAKCATQYAARFLACKWDGGSGGHGLGAGPGLPPGYLGM